MLPKPSDLQEYNFQTDVTEELSEETMSTGYHDNGPLLKLLLYRKLIRGPSSMFVPSFMVVSKSARFCHLFPGLMGFLPKMSFVGLWFQLSYKLN